jgi:hypothetical protein
MAKLGALTTTTTLNKEELALRAIILPTNNNHTLKTTPGASHLQLRLQETTTPLQQPPILTIKQHRLEAITAEVTLLIWLPQQVI